MLKRPLVTSKSCVFISIVRLWYLAIYKRYIKELSASKDSNNSEEEK